MFTKDISTLKIHKLSQEQYDRELAGGNIDEDAIYLTPEVELPFGEEYGDVLLTLSGRFSNYGDGLVGLGAPVTRTNPVFDNCNIGDLVEVNINGVSFSGRVKEFAYPDDHEYQSGVSMKYVGNAIFADGFDVAPDTGETFCFVDFFIDGQYVYEGESNSNLYTTEFTAGTNGTLIVRPFTVNTLPYKYAPYEEIIFDLHGAIDNKTPGATPIIINTKKCNNLNYFAYDNMKLSKIDDIANALLTKGKIRFFGPITTDGISSTADYIPYTCKITSVSPDLTFDDDIWVLNMKGVLKIPRINDMEFHIEISITSMESITLNVNATAVSFTVIHTNS